MKEKIPLSTVGERLSRRLNYPVGMNHLAVLIHGWRKKHPDQAPNFSTLYERKKNDGYAWLTPLETAFLGHYAGYDLSEN